MQETRVRFLGWEVPLEKGMAIHSIIHAWKIPWTEEPGGLQSVGPQRVGHDWATNIHTHTLLLRTLHHPLCAPWMLCLVAQSCLTLWTVWPMDPLSSSVQMDSPGKNTGVGCHALLQRIFWTQGSNPGLPHCQQILYDLSYQGSLLTLYTSF